MLSKVITPVKDLSTTSHWAPIRSRMDMLGEDMFSLVRVPLETTTKCTTSPLAS
jgi:hypothetical protein